METLKDTSATSLEEGEFFLAWDAAQQEKEQFQQLLDIESGIVFIAGTVGTGRTSLLASFVRAKQAAGEKVLNITYNSTEIHHVDSFYFETISSDDTPEAYNQYVKQMLSRIDNEAPSVLVLDDLNYEGTIDIAVDFAKRGGLVLATTYAHSYEEAVERLSFYVDDEQEADSFKNLVTGCTVLRMNLESGVPVNERRIAKVVFPS